MGPQESSYLPGPQRQEVTEGWRKVHKEELLNFYLSPNIIRITTSNRMRWSWHLVHMGETTMYTKYKS
jgi:hypothetical protein